MPNLTDYGLRRRNGKGCIKIYLNFSLYRKNTHIGMFGEKTMGKVFQFCHVNKERSGSRIEWHKPGDKCPNKNNQIVSGSSACRGCPEYLHDEKDGYVWCDPDMSYGRLK